MYDMRNEENRRDRDYFDRFGSWYHILALLALMMRR